VLRVSVHHDKFHTLDFGADHMIDSVCAGAADADNFDSGKRFNLRVNFGHILVSKSNNFI